MPAARAAIAFCSACIMAMGAGCSQPWTFSHAQPLGGVDLSAQESRAAPIAAGVAPGPTAVEARYQEPSAPPPACYPPPNAAGPANGVPYAPAAPGVVPAAANQPPPGYGQPPAGYAPPAPDASPPGFGPAVSAAASPVPPGTVTLGPAPPDAAWPGITPSPMPGPEWSQPLSVLQPAPAGLAEPLPSPYAQPAGVAPEAPALWQRMWDREFAEVRSDYGNYYSWPTLRDLGIGVAIAAVPANTSMDGHFSEWYQEHVHSAETNRIAAFWKLFGDGQYAIPPVAVLALINSAGWWDDSPLLQPVAEWGDRCARAYMVGAPPMLAMQEILGSGRPSNGYDESYWHPFAHDNGVSGHAFMSSVLFISAADMMPNQPICQGVLYACSMMTAWARIDENAHFLSEAALGWWMGYLACRAVDNTENAHRLIRIMPVIGPEMTGVGVMIER